MLYEIMPVDKHMVFADLKPDELSAFKAALPADTREEYERDGTASASGDPAKRVHNGKYVRRLRDYTSIFAHFRKDRAKFYDICDAEDRNLEVPAIGRERRQAADAVPAEDPRRVDGRPEGRPREVDFVNQHLKALGETLAAIKYDVEKRFEANVALAKKIVQEQLEAARRIDERSREIVRGGGGR